MHSIFENNPCICVKFEAGVVNTLSHTLFSEDFIEHNSYWLSKVTEANRHKPVYIRWIGVGNAFSATAVQPDTFINFNNDVNHIGAL